MEWTIEFPKEKCSWYWMKTPGFNTPEIVYVDKDRSIRDFWYGAVSLMSAGYLFCGPIEPPAAEQAKACETSKSPQNA